VPSPFHPAQSIDSCSIDHGAIVLPYCSSPIIDPTCQRADDEDDVK